MTSTIYISVIITRASLINKKALFAYFCLYSRFSLFIYFLTIKVLLALVCRGKNKNAKKYILIESLLQKVFNY